MKRLYRIEKGRKFLGVCGGIAEYFKIDPTLVRLIWVIGTIATFSLGFWGYLIAALVMPNKSELPEELRDSTIYDADVK